MIEALTITAAVLGFLFEWRRDGRREDEVEQLRGRVASLEEQVRDLGEWRNRTARAQ